MLEYSKMILDKVSFNRRLFWKEYKKSLNWLKPKEKRELRSWIIVKYTNRQIEKT